MPDNIYRLKGAGFNYSGGISGLNGIDLDVARGARIAVLGANGSGKSTLLLMLGGLIFPDKGGFTAFGKPMSEKAFGERDFSDAFRRKVGVLFQNPDVQLFCPTVKEDIFFGPLNFGMEKDKIEARYGELAALLGILHLAERPTYRLSVGEKKKVAIAATLIYDPEVLLLDEPTAGIDPLTNRRIIDVINDEAAKGKTVITATHDLHIVEEIADIAYVMGNDKKVTGSGPVGEILADNDLLSSANLLHIHRHKHNGNVHAHPHRHDHMHQH
jgi:cobalt/nickel transport system ATP-binding protein